MTKPFNFIRLGMLTLTTSLFLPLVALATTLTVSDNLIVSEIDDKKVENSFLSNQSTFSFSQGEHALILRYKDVFEDIEFAEDKLVESKKFVVKFTSLNEQNLILTTAEIKNLAAAEIFSKSPELILTDENKKQLPIKFETVEDYKLAKQVDIAINSQEPIQDVTYKANPELTTTAAISSAKEVSSTKTTDNTLSQIQSLKMLKYWWNKASAQEKQAFQHYIESNH